jgi:hypothetical protein
MAGDPAADRQALTQVINLGLVWHCLCAITRLEVPERLAAGPLPISELAAAVSADQDALGRVLRLVADHHIVTLQDDQVSLTDRGRLLCRDHPASLSAAFATVGTADVAHGLTDTLRTGRAAAPRVLGMPYWDYLATHPDQQALFDQAMQQRAGALSLACVPLLDWPASGAIADIAGGTGTLLAAVLQAAPVRIFEMLLPTDATPHRAKMSDVLMLLLFDGARERTLGQYRDLLEGTGWRLDRVVASPGPMSIIEASRSAPR